MSVRFAVDRRALPLPLVATLVSRLPAGVLAAALGMLALTAAPATAETPTHAPTYFFSDNLTGSGSNTLSEPIAVAVSEQSGDVYVLDKGNDRVEELSSSGAVITTFDGSEAPSGAFDDPVAIAVDNSTDPLDSSDGDVYVADAGHETVDKFSATGVYVGQITKGAGGASLKGLAGVAVDESGDVWVSVTEAGKLFNYTNGISNEFVTWIEVGSGVLPGDLAVNPSDNLAVLDEDGEYLVYSGEEVKEGEEATKVGELEPPKDRETGAAVDLAEDYYYVDDAESGEIEVFAFEGQGSRPRLAELFGSGYLSEGEGIAVDSATGAVYVANAASKDVAVFTHRRGEPLVEGESVPSVETGAATLEATIDPNGAETTYHFEYGLAAGKYEASVPIPAGRIAAGLSDVQVSARVTGLASGTTYHYRVVASNAPSGEVAGPDQAFTTLAPQELASSTNCSNEQERSEQPFAAALPDCRAYELVSPVNKEGVELERETGRVAISGNAAVYDSKYAFDKPSSSLQKSWYLSRRGPDGWTTQDISPPYDETLELDGVFPFEQKLFSPEVTSGVVGELYGVLSNVAYGFDDDYVADFAEGSYQLVTEIPPEVGPGGEGEPFNDENPIPFIGGTSADLSHVAFEERDLAPREEETTHVYVWVEETNKDYQVDIPPAGTTFYGSDYIGGHNGSGVPSEDVGLWHAVSEDGRRIFFTAGSNGQLYVRENPEAQQSPESGGKCTAPADACTVEVSASQRAVADPHGSRPAKPWGASVNGSRVFFTSNAELTENANTGPADNAPNLYEYDFEAPEGERLTDLTVDTEAADTDGAQVDGVAGLSENGSYVYYVAEGKLAGNENSHHDEAESGKPNLYLYHEGATTFIATLAPIHEFANEYGDHSGYVRGQGTRVSADGSRIAFMSERSLLGNDNQPATPSGECGPEGCAELYLYDATTGSLACASCLPSGAPPVGHPPGFEASGSDGNGQDYQPRNLSEDGTRLFFDSREPLLPQANNGLENVYEYENGHLQLLSDGSGAFESVFMEASPSGNDVFVTTTDDLIPRERENENNVYDVRVDGGFSAPPTPPTCDNADSCHGPESPQPAVFGSPPSATFSGPGNLTLASPSMKTGKATVKCAAGRQRDKRGKCVKKAKKKSKKAKRARRAGENGRAK